MKLIIAILFLIPIQALAVVDEPTGCLASKSFPCAARAKKNETLQVGAWKVHLFSGASVQWDLESDLRILSGKAWIQAGEGELVFPGLRYSLDKSELISFLQDGKLYIQNLEGSGHIKSEFVADIGLPVGFENWYGSMTSAGKLEQGVIRPFDVVAVLKDVKTLKTSVAMKDQMEVWKKSQSQTGDYYQRSVQQQVDSMQAMLKARSDKAREEQAERREMIRMFRERHALDRQF